jgi:YggT family protein
MRPIVFLTDWLLEPLRRLIPPLGMFDISPLVAWLLLILARSLVLGLL